MLSLDRLRPLQSAAIQLGLSRETLLAGIGRQFVATLPGASARSEQLLLDLVELSRAGTLTDGSKPLAIWLRNALQLTPLRKEAEVFRSALAELGEPAAEPSPAPSLPKAAARRRLASPAARTPGLHIGAGAIVVGGNVSRSKLVTAAPASKNSNRTRSSGKKKA